MKKLLNIFLLLMVFTLPACTRKVGWIQTNIGNSFTARYRFFDGVQRDIIRLDAEDSVTLTYDIEVIDGSLTLHLMDPNNELVWETIFIENANNTFEFTPEIEGRYRLNVLDEATEGSFDLEWKINK